MRRRALECCGNFIHLHHAATEEGNADHHGPAGNLVEDPEEVADGDSGVVLGKGTVKGVEPAIMVELELVGPILGVQVHEGLAGGRGEVQSLAPDVNLGRLGHHLESP
jgi:hypothetical protein